MPEEKTTIERPEIYELRPWYHDFSRLGLRTDFGEDRVSAAGAARNLWLALRALAPLPGRVEKGARLLSRATLRSPAFAHRINQRAKEAVLLPWLERCLREEGGEPRCLDLFCADGYYACTLAAMHPAASVLGLDLDPEEVRRGRAAAAALGLDRAAFAAADVWSWLETAGETYDLVLCAGGLYHLSEPRRLLEGLRRVAAGWLVVQSAVTLETEDPGYFEAPAPGWKHGCRFTHARLRSWLEDLGWRIEESRRGELPGNRRARDRGSSYFLCRAG